MTPIVCIYISCLYPLNYVFLFPQPMSNWSRRIHFFISEKYSAVYGQSVPQVKLSTIDIISRFIYWLMKLLTSSLLVCVQKTIDYKSFESY